MNSNFISNFGNTSSTIDALGASSSFVNYIVNCNFLNNIADKNTISLSQAIAVISRCKFTNNMANTRSKNLFIGFS